MRKPRAARVDRASKEGCFYRLLPISGGREAHPWGSPAGPASGTGHGEPFSGSKSFTRTATCPCTAGPHKSPPSAGPEGGERGSTAHLPAVPIAFSWSWPRPSSPLLLEDPDPCVAAFWSRPRASPTASCPWVVTAVDSEWPLLCHPPPPPTKGSFGWFTDMKTHVNSPWLSRRGHHPVPGSLQLGFAPWAAKDTFLLQFTAKDTARCT